MIEIMKRALDNRECCGILLLTDLSKAFDCVKHDLLIAKMLPEGLLCKYLDYISSGMVTN